MRIFQPIISGSTVITGSLTVTGSINVSSGITGSLQGTASYAYSSSVAVSSSYALNSSTTFTATSASFSTTASYVNPLNQTVQITGSVSIKGLTSVSSSSSFSVLNSSNADLLRVYDDGTIKAGNNLFLNNTSPFNTTPPPYVLNQFGGIIGVAYETQWAHYIGSTLNGSTGDTSLSLFGLGTGGGYYGGIRFWVSNNTRSASLAMNIDANQSVGIGLTNSTSLFVNASAKLEIQSTTKGFLLPRTNLVSNISTPAQGLQTYITSSTTEGIYYYNSGSYQGWTRILNDSGSQNITGSLNVTQGITGSLSGTASFATTASFYGGSVTSASYAATASYVVTSLTASYVNGNIHTGNNPALTASYAYSSSVAVSSSFAATSSYVNQLNQNVTINGALTVTGSSGTLFSSNIDTIVLTGSLIVTGSTTITGSLNIGISTITTNIITSSAAGANTVFNQATGSYTGAKYLYTIASASNSRTGEVLAVWNGTTTQYTDVSTLDIGSTSNVSASVSIVTAQAQFIINTGTSGWRIKSYVTYL